MKARGFTLIELMIVLAILPIVVAAVGAFYLEGRLSSARIEAQVNLTRRLSIAHEMIAQDLSSAEAIQPEENALSVQRQGRRIVYAAGPSGLKRSEGSSTLVLSPHIRALRLSSTEQGHTLRLVAERALLKNRKIRLDRQTFIARRR